MHFTAYNLHELWKEGHKDLYIYELTKSYRIIKHSINDLVSFDECIIISIGDNKKTPRNRLVFTPSQKTKKEISDSVFYTDFVSIKSRLNSKEEKKSVEALKEKTYQELEALKKLYDSLIIKYDKLSTGILSEEYLNFEKEDKLLKDKIIGTLQKTIFKTAERYGSDVVFTFLIDRLFCHLTHAFPTPQELGKHNEEMSIEDLQLLLNKSIKVEV